jgi:hypothetical protein
MAPEIFPPFRVGLVTLGFSGVDGNAFVHIIPDNPDMGELTT